MPNHITTRISINRRLREVKKIIDKFIKITLWKRRQIKWECRNELKNIWAHKNRKINT